MRVVPAGPSVLALSLLLSGDAAAVCDVPTVEGAAVANCSEGATATVGQVCTWSAEPGYSCSDLGDQLCDGTNFPATPECCADLPDTDGDGVGDACDDDFVAFADCTGPHAIPDGDLSYENFDIVVSGCAALQIEGTHSFRSLTVQGGAGAQVFSQSAHLTLTATLTVEAGALISASGRGYPGGDGPGVGTRATHSGSGGGGGGHGGNGSNGLSGFAGGTAYGSATAPVTRGSGGGGNYINPLVGGAGGGAIHITTPAFTLDGQIEADGETGIVTGGRGGGGGAGGSIFLEVGTLSGAGLLRANGGNGPNTSYSAGGGGGGRIAVLYDTNTFGGTLQACGGNNPFGSNSGGAGVVYLRDNASSEGSFHFDNCNYSLAADTVFSSLGPATGLFVSGGAQLVLPAATALNGDRTIGSGAAPTTSSIQGLASVAGNLELAAGASLHLPDLATVTGSLTVGAGSSAELPGLQTLAGLLSVEAGAHLILGEVLGTQALQSDVGVGAGATLSLGGTVEIAGDFTLDAGGATLTTVAGQALDLTVDGSVAVPAGALVSASGRGYPGGDGPGVGTRATHSGSGGGGGGHGGNGGNGLSGFAGGTAYGSATAPVTHGSGGGGNYIDPLVGGAGGGAIHITTPAFTLDGQIEADGETGIVTGARGGGGGAGGSIFLEVGTLSGAGLLRANGGDGPNASYSAGGGGGGRIAVNICSGTIGTSMQVLGGETNVGATPGENGTVTIGTAGDALCSPPPPGAPALPFLGLVILLVLFVVIARARPDWLERAARRRSSR